MMMIRRRRRSTCQFYPPLTIIDDVEIEREQGRRRRTHTWEVEKFHKESEKVSFFNL
jgi:hypothetical protein